MLCAWRREGLHRLQGPPEAAAPKFAPERPAGKTASGCPVVRDGEPRYGVLSAAQRRACAEFGWYHGVIDRGSVPWLA